MANTVSNIISGLKTAEQVDYALTNYLNLYYNFGTAMAVSATAPASVYGSYYLTNNEPITLYYQFVTVVTLASGSVAVMAGNTFNYGSIVTDGVSGIQNNLLLCNISTYPSTDEIESIAVTLNRFTDSGYTNLYDTTAFATYNLHMHSTLLTALETIISSDTFAGNSFDSWTPTASGGFYLTPAIVTSPYYNSSSGYSMGLGDVNGTIPVPVIPALNVCIAVHVLALAKFNAI